MPNKGINHIRPIKRVNTERITKPAYINPKRKSLVLYPLVNSLLFLKASPIVIRGSSEKIYKDIEKIRDKIIPGIINNAKPPIIIMERTKISPIVFK